MTRVTALVTLFLTLLRSWTPQYSMMRRWHSVGTGNSVESILDIAVASTKMGPKVAECTVKGDVGSDHLPVHIRLNYHEVEKTPKKAVHRLDKANWQKFGKELKSIEMGDLTTPEKIEKAVELLETSMICALGKRCQSVKQKEQDFFIQIWKNVWADQRKKKS